MRGQPLVAALAVCLGWVFMRIAALHAQDKPPIAPAPLNGKMADRASANGTAPDRTAVVLGGGTSLHNSPWHASPIATAPVSRRASRLTHQPTRHQIVVKPETVPMVLAPSQAVAVFLPSPLPEPAATIWPRVDTATLSVVPAAPSRWSGAFWLLARPQNGLIAPASPASLGGAQAGFRITRNLVGSRLALSAGGSTPLHGRDGREVRLGLSWRPIRAVPVELLAERRIGLSAATPSRTVILVAGGISTGSAESKWQVDAYAQAGIAGLRSRMKFADGQITATRPLLPEAGLRLGFGSWAAAQPGAARFDVGPVIEKPVKFGDSHARIALQWRQRIAGTAAPASGPALVIATGF